MLKNQKNLILVGITIFGLNLVKPVNAQNKLLSQCQKVNYPIGLNVRLAPNSKSPLIKTLAYGWKVKLAGKKIDGNIIPIIEQDPEGNFWIKIKTPVKGFILFAHNPDRDSLIPCQTKLSQ